MAASIISARSIWKLFRQTGIDLLDIGDRRACHLRRDTVGNGPALLYDFFLGYPITDEIGTPDGVGRFNHFRRLDNGAEASICWTSQTDAYAVYGAIRDKWAQLGWETFLGYPIADRSGAPDGVGRFNHFRRLDNGAEASIYWTPQTVLLTLFGALSVTSGAQWVGSGAKSSYPVSDEYQDGSYRRSDFEKRLYPLVAAGVVSR